MDIFMHNNNNNNMSTQIYLSQSTVSIHKSEKLFVLKNPL